MWQLIDKRNKKILRSENKLPENWANIFGLENIKERLGNLTWLGKDFENLCWIEIQAEIDETVQQDLIKNEVDEKVKRLLQESDWTQLFDSPLSQDVRQKWILYRKELRNINKQPGYPKEVLFPARP